MELGLSYPGVEDPVEPSQTVLREALATVEQIAVHLQALVVSAAAT